MILAPNDIGPLEEIHDVMHGYETELKRRDFQNANEKP